MVKSLLRRIAHLCLQHYRIVLISFFVIFGVAFLLTGRLRFDPDFLNLFPAERPPIKLYLEGLKRAGTFDALFLLLEREEGVQPETLLDSGRRIYELLRSLEIDGKRAFKRVRLQKVEEEDFEGAKAALTLFLSHPYLFLDEGDVPRLKQKWSREEIERQVRKNRRVLVSHASFVMKDLVQLDPFELRWFFMEKWRSEIGGLEFDESSNFFLSKDRKSLLILGEPTQPAMDIAFTKSLMNTLEKSISSAPFLPEKGINVFYTGAYPIVMSEAKILRFDMQSSFLSSMVLVLLLFLFAYRRWITLFFAAMPLFGGIQLTMGIASLVLGRLNILTASFAAILVGLGIDFSIHLYDRYHHERASGKDISSAVETTLTETGVGIWTGAFTTICAFAILYFSRVRGIVELAFLVSVGLFCLLFCTYFVLPSFLIWLDKRGTYSYQPLKTFRFKHFIPLLEKRRYLFFLGLIGVTLFSIWFAFRIEVERDFRNLRPKEIKSLGVLERMGKAFGGRKLEAMAIRGGKELDRLLLEDKEFNRTLERYQKEGKIEARISPSDLIPTAEIQRKVARVIRNSIDLDRVKKDFIAALKENGFEIRAFDTVIHSLEDLRQGSEKIYPSEVLIASLHQSPLRQGVERLVFKQDESYRLLSRFYYQKGKLSLPELEKDVSGVSITGPERVESEILRVVKEDLFLLTPIAFLIIVLLVFLHFKTWKMTLFTLTPLAMGLTWMTGAMSLLGIRINFVNAVILPMIIGMGIDNSVHLMHRYLGEGRMDAGKALRTTGRAMVMCSLTTILGFGSLVTARYQALSTMGWVTILGMGSCLITSLCFLPTLLLLWKERNDEQEGL